jgi:hypothetical protein
MIDLMNGHLRTPKHSIVQIAVDWYNKNKGTATLLPVTRDPMPVLGLLGFPTQTETLWYA